MMLLGVSLQAADPAPKNPSTPAGAVATNEPTKSAPIDIPIPIGEPVSGIKIPQYDESGKLSMTLLAGKARKLDDKSIEFDNLKISFTDKEGKEILVEIPHALLDVETKMLTADSKTAITRDDFDIIGDQAEFDTVSRTGKFKGRVRASFRNETTIGQPSS
jgi:lipopolysaccharide export system protein LptC